KTSTIPIVFTMVTDPVGQGFVENLARPGGNITGFSDFNSLMAGKWLEMLTQVAPPVARVAVLYNPATAPYAGLMMRAVEDAAPSFAITAQSAPCRDAAEIQSVMAELAREGRGGLLVLTDISPSCIAIPSSPPPRSTASLLFFSRARSPRPAA